MIYAQSQHMIVKKKFMDDLTQAYAHLEYESKVKAAQAMSWIDQTSLTEASKQLNINGLEGEKTQPPTS